MIASILLSCLLGAQGPSPDRQMVADSVRNQRAGVDSLSVDYAADAPAIGVRTLMRFTSLGADRMRFETTKADARVAADAWPSRCVRYVTALSGGECRMVVSWPNRRIFSQVILADMTLPAQIEDPFFLVTGWWPASSAMRHWAGPDARADVLEVLADPRFDFALTGMPGARLATMSLGEVHRCVLDESKGWAVAERVIRDPHAEGSLRVAVREWRELRPGFWIPAEYDLQRRPDDPAKQVSATVVKLISGAVNSCDGREAVFEPLAGAMEMDPPTKELTQVVPGGLDFLRAAGMRLRDQATASTAAGFGWTHLGFGLGGALCVLGFATRRDRRIHSGGDAT